MIPDFLHYLPQRGQGRNQVFEADGGRALSASDNEAKLLCIMQRSNG
jgi:hypothetical protein